MTPTNFYPVKFFKKNSEAHLTRAINHRFRLDRFLTLYFFYPLLKLKPKHNEIRIPILMYHSISEPGRNRRHPYYETCTSPQVFAEHMKFLYENNYKVITLDQAVEILKSSDSNSGSQLIDHDNRKSTRRSNSPSHMVQTGQQFKIQNSKFKINTRLNQPQRFVVLTFDDGFKDFYTDAFPILQEYDFQATVFLPTAFIGKNRKEFKGKECLSWDEVRELSNKGIKFGSHTVNHHKLRNLKMDEIEFEIKKSKEDIENKIGKSIRSFSYPYKFPEGDKKYIENVRRLIIESGYKNSVSTKIGTNGIDNDYIFLKRVPINMFDDKHLFKAKLENAYSWLHPLQLSYKRIKNIFEDRKVKKQ